MEKLTNPNRNGIRNQIALEITNNLDLPAKVLILGNNFNPMNQANAKKYYEYNLAPESFIGVSQVRIAFTNSDMTQSYTKTVPLYQPSTEGVAAALTSMNMGFWMTSGGVVYTYNANWIYGNLEIF